MAAWRNWLRTLLKGGGEKLDSSHSFSSPSSPSSSSIPSLSSTSYVPLLPLREWVIQHTSPFAWDRAIIRLLSVQRDPKLSLFELLKPSASTQISEDLYDSLSRIIREMYGFQVPQNLKKYD
ncbi:MAG: hypothetical protein RMK19_04775 [Bacteroidia bacterium]|nr:hypothetical protein [Bacteroidia bacterium]MDW8015305.1 hypothetical protein [Bacteroidia bacterium]